LAKAPSKKFKKFDKNTQDYLKLISRAPLKRNFILFNVLKNLFGLSINSKGLILIKMSIEKV